MLVDVAAGMLYVVMKRHMNTVSSVKHSPNASDTNLASSLPSSMDRSVLSATMAATLPLSQAHLSDRLGVYLKKGRTQGWGTRRADVTTSMPDTSMPDTNKCRKYRRRGSLELVDERLRVCGG